jgi:glycosyltransferase involved in cell wall biosynthesis
VTVLENLVAEAFFVRRDYRACAKKLLFVGQWLPMKGTKALVESYVHLRRENPDLRLICAGTLVPEPDVLNSFPPEVRDSVTVRSRVRTNELVDLHREADVFLFPTLSEGFSLALAEAMASGLPIVTTRVGAAPDLLIDGKSVLFVPGNESSELAAAVQRLLDERQMREGLGVQAQRAAQRLRPELALWEFGVCFELLASARHSGDNGTRLSMAAMSET